MTIMTMAKKKTGPKDRKTMRNKGHEPTISAILLCDAISVDPNSGKTTLYGIFDKLNVFEPNHSVSAIKIYTKISGGKGKHEIGVQLISQRGKVIAIGGKAEVTCKENQVVEGYAQFGNIKFPRPGGYRIHATIDGKQIDPPCHMNVIFKEKPKQLDDAS